MCISVLLTLNISTFVRPLQSFLDQTSSQYFCHMMPGSTPRYPPPSLLQNTWALLYASVYPVSSHRQKEGFWTLNSTKRTDAPWTNDILYSFSNMEELFSFLSQLLPNLSQGSMCSVLKAIMVRAYRCDCLQYSMYKRWEKDGYPTTHFHTIHNDSVLHLQIYVWVTVRIEKAEVKFRNRK